MKIESIIETAFILTLPAWFVYLTIGPFCPFVLSRKLDKKWLDHVRKKTYGFGTDATPLGFFGRPQAYARAATFERSARKNFGVSRDEFRSDLNRTEIIYSWLLTWSCIIFFASMPLVLVLSQFFNWPHH